MLRLACAATLALILGSGKGTGNEFWISPAAYRWAPGEVVLADLRVGAAFTGTRQGFVPQSFTRFEILTGDSVIAVEGSVGDIPALGGLELPEGLAVIVHETAGREMTWDDWDRFAAFADHKGLGDVTEMKAARGPTPADMVREEYVRYAKSLVAIGHGAGTDRVVGLRTELVALANPYTDDLAGAMPVQLYVDGAPRSMARVEVFARPADGGGETAVSVYETDSNGIVVLPIRQGTEYLVTAVTLEFPGDPEADVEAEADVTLRTLWASLTFEAPRPEPSP
jgi:hypothetical protein